MKYFPLILIMLALPAFIFADDSSDSEKGFMGIFHAVITDIPKVDGAPEVTGGILVRDTRDNTPAYKGGLRSGDIIISLGGFDFDCDSDQIETLFKSILDNYKPDDKINVTILRMIVDSKLIANDTEYNPKEYLIDPDSFVLNLPHKTNLTLDVEKEWILKDLVVTLGRRNEGALPPPPHIDDTDLADILYRPEWEQWLQELVERYDINDEYLDLRNRLKNLHASDDGFRNTSITAIHRDPYLVESIARNLTDIFLHASSDSFSDLLLFMTGEKHSWLHPNPSGLDHTVDADGFKDWFVSNMKPLITDLMTVYDVFSDDEKQFLLDHRFELIDAFSEHIYIHIDKDQDRLERNRKTIQLGGKIDQTALYKACDAIMKFIAFTHDDVFHWMENNPDVRSIETPWGKIGFGSKGHDWWRDGDFKFIYDPAGNDLYSDGTGVANSFDKPVAWIVDLHGDDAYQSTAPYGAQGSGVPGFGFVYDKNGNDTYIGQRFSQGAGFMGIGILIDHDGDDRYYGSEFVQGVGMFGLGILHDGYGDDTYFAQKHAQGAGFTNGMGVLYDACGNDYGFATGKYPTNYGDPGIFDAWSQGVGMGFRGVASGGIGVLVNDGGDSFWEAGNFSQGGGYYYGMGIFRSAGNGNDKYIGSRYAQGFSAHQAIGVFIEDGGNDSYHTRQSVNAGLAWDESVTLFIDQSGNDYYNGGSGFSLGASAHNSITIFIDNGGKNEFHLNAGPARAGGNDYHGGHSVSLFVVQGDETNLYSSDKVQNDIELAWPDFGFFRDGKAEPIMPFEKPTSD